MKTEFNFTPFQRLEIYRQALAMIQMCECNGLCHALLSASRDIFNSPLDFTRLDFSLEFFPEIKKHKVVDKVYWFPRNEFGRQQRMLILKSAIAEVETLLNTKI